MHHLVSQKFVVSFDHFTPHFNLLAISLSHIFVLLRAIIGVALIGVALGSPHDSSHKWQRTLPGPGLLDMLAHLGCQQADVGRCQRKVDDTLHLTQSILIFHDR